MKKCGFSPRTAASHDIMVELKNKTLQALMHNRHDCMSHY